MDVGHTNIWHTDIGRMDLERMDIGGRHILRSHFSDR